MAKVVIASLHAGGGHITAMYSIEEAIRKYSSDLEVECFISKDEQISFIHTFCYTKFPLIYDLIYKISHWKAFFIGQQIVTLKNKNFKKELKHLFEDQETKVIISTHFILTQALLSLKKKLNSKIKIIVYVPDFDISIVHFPKIGGILADGLIAQNPELINIIINKFQYPRSQTVKGGYITKNEFTDLRDISRIDARKLLAKEKIENVFELENFHPNKFTIVIGGGSGWASRIYKKAEEIVESNRIDWNKTQLGVITGRNGLAFKKYTQLKLNHKDKVIFPLPFLTAKQMALVYRSSDLVILAGIAPATMYELIETESVPFIVSYVNPGQEKLNLKFGIDNHIFKLVRKPSEIITHIEKLQKNKAFNGSTKAEYLEYSEKERALAIKNAELMVKFIKGFC